MVAKFLEGGAYGILNDILSAFRSNEGYALPSKYEVLIYPPAGRTGTSLLNVFSGMGSSAGESRNVSMRCESCILPGTNVTSSPDTNPYGPVREIAESVTYATEVSMTFQASSDLKERLFFEKWQKKCYNPTSWNIGYYNDYIGSVDIYLLDTEGTRRFGLKLHEVWPKTLGATSLSGAKASDIIKNEITFVFRNWTSLDANDQPPSIADRITNTVVNTVERNLTRNIPAVLRKL